MIIRSSAKDQWLIYQRSILLDAPFYECELTSLTAQAANLSHAREPRLHVMPKRVTGDQGAVLIVKRDRVRPRANDRHVASNNVEELRKLVDAGAAQQLPDPRPPPVTTSRLNDRLAVVHHRHCTEFVYRKFPVAESNAPLPK